MVRVNVVIAPKSAADEFLAESRPLAQYRIGDVIVATSACKKTHILGRIEEIIPWTNSSGQPEHLYGIEEYSMVQKYSGEIVYKTFKDGVAAHVGGSACHSSALESEIALYDVDKHARLFAGATGFVEKPAGPSIVSVVRQFTRRLGL